MNVSKGYFFEHDKKGFTDSLLFRYTHVSLTEKAKYEAMVPINPIYLVLEENELIFYFHGLRSIKKSNQNKEEKSHIEHINVPFFRISIFGHKQIEHTLNEELLQAYEDVYCIDPDFYGLDPIDRFSYCGSYPPIKSEKLSSQKCYPFDSDPNGKESTNKQLKIQHKRLLLDFIFDFENFNIFDTNPNSEKLFELLHSNPSYMAIFCKADYYFQKARMDLIFNSIDISSDVNFQLWRNDFLNAEEIWTDQIRKPEFERLCLQKSCWFESNTEAEYRSVLQYNCRKMIVNKHIGAIQLSLRKINNQLDLSGTKKEPGNKVYKKPRKLCSWLFWDEPCEWEENKIFDKYSRLNNHIINHENNKELEKEWGKIKKEQSLKFEGVDRLREADFLKKASDWFLKRYSIWHAFHILFKFAESSCPRYSCIPILRVISICTTCVCKIIPIVISTFIVLSAFLFLFLGWIETFISASDRKIIVNIVSFYIFPLVFFLSLMSFLLFCIFSKEMRLKILSIFTMRLQMILIITWTSIALSEKTLDYIKEDVFERIHIAPLIFMMAILILIVFLFVQFQIRQLAPSNPDMYKRASFYVIFTILSSASIGTIIMSPLYEFSWSQKEYFKFHKSQRSPASSLFDSSSLSTLPVSTDNQTRQYDTVICREILPGSETEKPAQSHIWEHHHWPFLS